MKTKLLIITGGSSKLGITIINFFLSKKWKVIALINKNSINLKNVINIKINFNSNQFLIKKLNIYNPDMIIHAAWNTKNKNYINSKKNLVWLKNSIIFFEQFKNLEKCKIIVFGSCAEYDWNKLKKFNEENKQIPNTVYGKSKLELYLYLKKNIKSNSLTWLRYFFIFGPTSRKRTILFDAYNNFLNNKKFIIKQFNNKIDFIYEDDAHKITLDIIKKNISGIINIGTGNGITLLHFIQILERIMMKKNLIYYTNKNYKKKSIISNNNKLIKHKIFIKMNTTEYKDYIKKSIKKLLATLQK